MLAKAKSVLGGHISVDASTMEAKAARRTIVRLLHVRRLLGKGRNHAFLA